MWNVFFGDFALFLEVHWGVLGGGHLSKCVQVSVVRESEKRWIHSLWIHRLRVRDGV